MHRTFRTARLLALMTLTLFATTQTVLAAPPSPPPPTSTSKDSKKVPAPSGKIWGTNCEANPATKKEDCFVSQEQRLNDKLVLRLTVGRSGPERKTIMIATLPLGILIPPGVGVQLDPSKEDLFRLDVRYCSPGGCVASAILDDKNLALLRKATNINVLARQSDNTKNIAFPVKMDGFEAEFKAIK